MILPRCICMQWTALDRNDYTNYALHHYSASSVSTTNGTLDIVTDYSVREFPVPVSSEHPDGKVKKVYRSGMLQGALSSYLSIFRVCASHHYCA